MSSRQRAARLRRQARQRSSAAALDEALTAAAHAVGTATMEASLSRDLGVSWVRRPDGRGREIAGVPQDLLDAYSSPASIPPQVLAAVAKNALAAGNDAAQHQPASTEPIVYPVPGVRGLTEPEARQMMADGLRSVQTERRTWTRYDLLRHIAWSTPAHAFTDAGILETLTSRAIGGEAGIPVELVSQPGPERGGPDGRRYQNKPG